MMSRRKTVTLFLAVLAAFGWLYVFFFSDYFVVTVIKTVDREGKEGRGTGRVIEAVTLSVLDEERVWPFRARNIFFIDERCIAERLREELFLEDAIVDKKYPNILRLKLVERQSSIIIRLGETYGEIDHAGIVTRVLSFEEAKAYERLADSPSGFAPSMPILVIASNPATSVVASTTSVAANAPSANLVAQESIADASTVLRWLDAFQELKKWGFGYRRAVLESVSSTKLEIRMFEPYSVYMDLLAPFDAQIEGYDAFMKNKPSGMRIAEYVDVRIPGKIFFK